VGKPNYQFEKRLKDLKRKKKQEEKRQRKLEKQLKEKENPISPSNEEAPS